MALKLNERYPGRFDNPSAGYPQGSFKNRTSPTAKDGSYLERDWANDKEGFFQSLLSSSGFVANGTVDKVGASQYFDSLVSAIRSKATGRVISQQLFTSTATYTPTPGIAFAIVECVGGGGGSAHVLATGASQYATTAGGQAGHYTRSRFTAAQLAGGVLCTIGAAGVGANAGGITPSSNGGSTTFGALVTAGGGNRSSVGILSSGTYLSAPSGAPTTVFGSFQYSISGQPGSWGIYSSGSGQLGGNGGSSMFGGGGIGVGIGAAAQPGSGYGAGGGASSLGPNSSSIGGAAGSGGLIVITEYI
ncbi:hypothetical protein [Pseudomonas viridiflava]|uniref:glycine-rich domain-containing protein n=1 Tax=Pseudomonas viridiflava TaxID=33069 RepID=UPI000F020FD1|nr:hypothetical protein [Pseudomonas viridiflava]